MAERGHSRARGAQQAQLVPGDDADHRQSQRNGRGRQGDAGRNLRGGASRPLRVLHPVDLHAAPRYADGEEEGRDRDEPADTASVAADDEVLEDESPSGSGELVGADRVARRVAVPLGVEAPEAEWAWFYVAVVSVRRRAA